MEQYKKLLQKIINEGNDKGDRTGTGTRSIFGHQMEFDLSEGFPILTTKYVNFKSIVVEMLWMLSGETNIASLNANGCHIWDEWADENGYLGKIYGAHWRGNMPSAFTKSGVAADQIQELVKNIKSNPNSRRLIVSSWHPDLVPSDNLSPQENIIDGKQALASCCAMFQCYVSNGKLSLQLYQRSADAFLGLPFNIASYALLTHLLVNECNLEAGKLIWSGGDVHIYNDHKKQVELLLIRKPYKLPHIEIDKEFSIFNKINYGDLTWINEDQAVTQMGAIKLVDYSHHPYIPAKVSV